ncbi:tyrosine-type recombinase/integrase [Idiomarina baltica]|uniref:Integrase n=1 Tax=Idiomarina baltica OS145 TaxID=314276 RepID=A0ABP2CR11_9GAMM|nr:site-specific integrase [Idiomarina baltica]EAQ32310.1 putative integrase [Idiomarina baltica OS145]
MKYAQFTVKHLKGLEPRSKKYEEWETSSQRNTGRLGVVVYPSGTKTFVFRYYVNSKRSYITLGTFPDLSLTKAREKANLLSQSVANGVDPKTLGPTAISAKVQSVTTGSFGELIEYYVSDMRRKGRRTADEVKADLERNALPIIPAGQPANQVSSEQIKRVLAVMIRRGAVAHSNRVRAYLHAAFSAGLKHDNNPADQSSSFLFRLEKNPVAVIPTQRHAEIPRDRLLAESELEKIFEALNDSQKNGVSADFRLLIKVHLYSGGQRPFEIMNSKWSDIDFETGDWLMHGDITKNGRDHIIPLTPQLTNYLEQLKSFAGISDLVMPKRNIFTEAAPSSSLAHAYKKIQKRYGIADFQPRDLRRTAKTLMLRHKMGTENHLNRLHNHAFSDVSNRHYNRYDYRDEKLEILERWSKLLDELGGAR